MTDAAATTGDGRLPFARVLVTGGNGFVGSYLLPALADRLRDTAICTVGARTDPAQWHGNYRFLDLADPPTIRRVIAAERPDAVIHLAAQSSVATSSRSAESTWRSNFVGTLELANELAASGTTGTFLFVSSAEVYGTTFNHERATEQSALRPTSPYARSKAAAEAMLADVLPREWQLIVGRPTNHSGPGQSSTFVIPSFAEQIATAELDDEAVVQVGELETRRDFLHVSDVVAGYLHLCCRAGSLPARATVNIAAGTPTRIRDLLDLMLGMASRPIAVTQDPARMRPSEVPTTNVDDGAMRSMGWRPEISLERTVADVLDYHRSLHRRT